MSGNIIYIIGDDAISRSKELSIVVDELAGDEDKSLLVDNFDLANCSTDEDRNEMISNVIYALQSPPFLTSKRIVVLRDVGAATSENCEPLIKYFEDISPTSYLVALQGGGRISVKLTKAWKPLVVQKGIARQAPDEILAQMMKAHSISFGPGVRDAILSHCAEDATKLTSLIDRLVAVYGDKQKLELDDVQDYFGESGNVAIYELANEICSGNVAKSLDILNRMLRTVSSDSGKSMHPLQVISLLANHFRKLATLDDPSISNQNDAHAALGSKGNPYGAKKNWELARRLGSKKLLSCLELMGTVDVAVKGATAIEGDVALELCIISLCEICEDPYSMASKSFSTHFAIV